MKFTLEQLLVTITSHSMHLGQMHAPSRTGFGVGNSLIEVAVLPKDRVNVTPDEVNFDASANPNRENTVPDIWDFVWIKENGKWRCHGNRFGGVRRFGELCAEAMKAELA